MLRVLLNNIPAANGAENISGLEDVYETLELKPEIHGYLLQVEGSLTFSGQDYDTLRALYDSNYCQDVDLIVQQSMDFGNTWHTKIKAIIKLAGVKWDRVRKEATTPIVDNSWQSRMYNNRQIVFQLGSYTGEVFSKNGVDVSNKVVYSLTDLFSPFRGRYFTQEATYNTTTPPYPASVGDLLIDLRPGKRPGMFIWDVFNLLVAMLTDDEVEFKSDYFDYFTAGLAGSNEEAACKIFTGQCLKTGSGYPKLNFEQFFNDIHKLCNVWFGFEVSSTGKPVFRVEQESYFRQSNSNVFFDNVESMVEAVDLGRVYSKVVVGCSVSSGGNFPVGEIPLIQHSQEEFPLSGTCNVSNELNLRLEKLIINTNAIADALPAISGFKNGGSVKRKFTNEETTAGSGGINQMLIDTTTGASFQETLIQQKFLIENPRTGDWSYITGVPDDDRLLIYDLIFTVDNTGATKDYELYKPGDDTQFSEEVFLIQMDKDSLAVGYHVAKQQVIDPPNDIYIYNPTFANYQVITRHMGGVAQSIVNSLSDGNDEFRAERTGTSVLSNSTAFQTVSNSQYRRIRFDDETTAPNFDTNGNYNNLTGSYIAPKSGYYHFYTEVEVNNFHALGENFIQQIELQRVTASGYVLESETFATTILNTSSYTFQLDRIFYLREGEKAEVWVKSPFNTSTGSTWYRQYIPFSEFGNIGSYGYRYSISPNTTYFECQDLENGGGVVPASDPQEARLIVFQTEMNISRSEFDSVLANPYKYYHTNFAPITENPKYLTGFIQKASRKILSGETTMEQFKKHQGV